MKYTAALLQSVFILSLLGYLNPTIVLSQTNGITTASLTGVISDETDNKIANANITIKSLSTNLVRKITTQMDGSFAAGYLPPDQYELTVEVSGFTPHSQILELTLRTTSLINIKLKVEGTKDYIEVSANNVFTTDQTEISNNNNRTRIESLPINRRNLIDFSLTSPTVVRDRVFSDGVAGSSGLSFNGQSARFNNITIDGLDNNDLVSGSIRSTFSQDAVQEFQVLSNGFSAEFGRSLGGLVNIITRNGSNQLHGNIFFFQRNDKTSARNAFANKKPSFEQDQLGFVLGGPIKKDKSFFFTSFERFSSNQSNIVTISEDSANSARRQGFPIKTGAVPFAVGLTTALVRFDTQLTSNDSLWIRYNYGGSYNGALEPFGALVAESNGGVQRLDDNTIALSNTYINPKLSLVNETRFLYGRREQKVLPLDDGPQLKIIAPEGQLTIGRGIFLPQFRSERFYQFVNTTTISQQHHQWKFGVDYLYTSFPNNKSNLPLFPGGLDVFVPIDFSQLFGIANLPFFTGLQTFDPSLRTPAQKAFLTLAASQIPTFFPGFPKNLPLANLSIPITVLQGFGDSNLTVNASSLALFGQDDIKLTPNLLVKLGIRYDITRIRFNPDNKGNLSPRISFSYHPFQRKFINLHGSYGLIFGGSFTGTSFSIQPARSGNLKVIAFPFPFSILAFAQPGHRYPESKTIPPGVAFIPQLSQTAAIQKDLRNSYSQQINLGVDYQIGKHTLFSLNYNFIRGIKLLSSRNINPIVRPSADPVTNALTGRPDPTQGDIFELESAFDSYYHGFSISFSRQFTNNLTFFSYYTFSKAIDNFFEFRIDRPEAAVSNPLRPGDERGLSLQDARQRAGFSSNWKLNFFKNPILKDFQLSSIISLESGRPYNLLAGVDLNQNGDNPPGDRPLGLGHNVGITPDFATVDLRFSRVFSIKEKLHLEGIFEVFNLFNRVNISDLDPVFPPDSQGNFSLPKQKNGRYITPPERYRNAFSPRQIQLGIKISF